MGASCTVETTDAQPPPKEPDVLFEVDPHQLVVVRLSADVPKGAGLRTVEDVGLALALLESGLAEVSHVLPIVEGAGASPGLASWGGTLALPWRARVAAQEVRGELTVKVELCDASGLCSEETVQSSLLGLPRAMAPLYGALARLLLRPPLPGAEEETWSAPLSEDPYALRVVGRAAASVYGLLPPVAPEHEGDRRRDPVARAVFLDPSLSLAQWMAGRWHLARGEAAEARQAFTRAALEGKRRVLFRADEAAAILAEGHGVEAVKAWEAVRHEAPEDVRFVPALAKALLTAGSRDAALALLDALPARYQRGPAVLPLRARLAELGTGKEDYDGLLAEWQALEPELPEPRLKRIQLRIRQARLSEALAMVQELGKREGGEREAQLGMALAVGTGDWHFALEQADLAKLPRVAASIRARAALETRPAEIPPELAHATDAQALLARGHAYLAMGRFGAALVESTRLLEQRPWYPEGLALRARAQWGLGREGDATRTEEQLRFVDPTFPADTELPPYGEVAAGGPKTAPGNTGRGSQAQAGPP
jgi:tetratricopeptide (TPR) repeat protein